MQIEAKDKSQETLNYFAPLYWKDKRFIHLNVV